MPNSFISLVALSFAAAAAAPTEKPSPASPVSTAQASLVFAGESDQAVVGRVVAALEAVTTLEGDFTQVAPSGAVSTGAFYLRRPGLLRFDYNAPTPLQIVANGGMVFVRDEALKKPIPTRSIRRR